MRAFFVLLICFAGCGSINEMNSNMQTSNRLMEENIVVMNVSKESIEENTRHIEQSTDTMKEFAEIIKENTAVITGVMDTVHGHSYALSMGLAALLILLFLPSVILVILFKKIK